MPPLRALKTDDEAAGIPLDQTILIELPGSVIEEEPGDKPGKVKQDEPIDGAKVLQEQLENAQRAQAASDARAEKAEREAAEARRIAAEATKRSTALEGDVITGGLSAAQSELAAAEAELERSGEAGDFKAMAKAQSRIGRASAQILSYEAGAAEVAERATIEKTAPRQEQTRQAADPIAAIDSNPNLLPAEREWLKAHPDAVVDMKRNNELGVAYERAIKKDLVRGTPAYFNFLNEFMGYEKPSGNDDNHGSGNVQAPPSRGERDTSGRQTNNRITLSPEERDIAKSMGVSDIEYAKSKQNLEAARKADPDKYR